MKVKSALDARCIRDNLDEYGQNRKSEEVMDQKKALSKLPLVAALCAILTLASEVSAQQPAAGAPAEPAKPQGTANVPSTPSNKVVLKVGNQQVTADDVNFVLRTLNAQDQKAVANQGRRPLGEQYALTLLLAQQAAQDHLDATPEFRRQEAWERSQRLAQAEYEKMAQSIKINPEEVGQYYSQHTKDFEQVEIRQVGIRKKAEGAKADLPGLAPQEAEAKADAIRKAITTGTDFQKVSTEFAVPNVVFIDPGPKKLQRGQLSGGLDKEIFALKAGELSQSINTPQSIFFVQVLKHLQPDLKEVRPMIESTLRQERLQAQLGDLKKKSGIWMDEDYFKPAPAASSGASSAGNPQNPPARNAAPKP